MNWYQFTLDSSLIEVLERLSSIKQYLRYILQDQMKR